MATRALDLNQPVRRTARRPAPRQVATPRTRSDLRVAPRPRTAARRRRLLLTVVTTLTIVLAFGVAASQVVVAQNQARLDKLDQRATDAKTSYEKLRYQVAQLESPERVVAAAKDRLGMIEPARVTYVAPPASTADATTAADAHAGYRDVKAALASK